jgi:hypothetical protein
MCPCTTPTVTATITMHLLHRPNPGGRTLLRTRSVRNEKVSLTTTLITKLLTETSQSRDQECQRQPETDQLSAR